MLDDMDKLVSLCKRRGFIFPSSEIYGGINGFWGSWAARGRAEAEHQGSPVARDNVQDARRHGSG